MEMAALVLAYIVGVALIIGGAVALSMSRRRRSAVARDVVETTSAYAHATVEVEAMPPGIRRIRAERLLDAAGAEIDNLVPVGAPEPPPPVNLNNW
jgi:hypothetical protein